MENRVCRLFGTEWPIVQGGMVWCAGWKLASSVSNSGGLGLLGAGSMHPETFQEHVKKMKQATDKPWGVNLPLLYPEIDKVIDTIIQEGVQIVFTSAGNPAKWTSFFKEKGLTVVHVVSNLKFALKCVEAGVDAIVAEGFEAGGHNGREETTTLTLIPLLRKQIEIPLLAAGGIGSGQAILAAQCLGADGVQIGSLFATTKESSAHENFKQHVVDSMDGDTRLRLKKLVPTRLMHNEFSRRVDEYESRGASVEELRELLGKGRAKKGIFEGDLSEGELEIGQVASSIDATLSVAETMEKLIVEYREACEKLIP